MTAQHALPVPFTIFNHERTQLHQLVQTEDEQHRLHITLQPRSSNLPIGSDEQLLRLRLHSYSKGRILTCNVAKQNLTAVSFSGQNVSFGGRERDLPLQVLNTLIENPNVGTLSQRRGNTTVCSNPITWNIKSERKGGITGQETKSIPGSR